MQSINCDVCELELPTGKIVLLDEYDYERWWRFKWRMHSDGLVGRYKNGQKVKLHREIMEVPPGTHVKFKNDNPLDCKRCNLVVVGFKPIPGTPVMPVGDGRSIVFDADDYDKVNQYRWRMLRGIPVATIDGKTTPLARFLINAPKGSRITYADGDKFNCQKENLSCDD